LAAADDIETGLFPQQLDQPHVTAGILDNDGDLPVIARRER